MGQQEGHSRYAQPLPNYMPSATQMRHAPFRWTPRSCLTGDLQLFSPLGQYFYLASMPLYPIWLHKREGSRSSGTSALAGSNFSHPGVPGGWAPAVGDTPNLPILCLPLVLTSWPHFVVPPQPARLVVATGGLHLFWHCFLYSPQAVRGPLSKGYPPLWLGRAGRLGPPPKSAPAAGSHMRALCSNFGFPTVGGCLGIFSLMSPGPGSPTSATTRTSAATRVAVAPGASLADRVAHPFHVFFKHCHCHRAHQWASLIRAIIPSYEFCFTAVNYSYMLWLAAANSIWGSGQGTSASNYLHSPSGCADSHLSWRHSLMELRISLWRYSSVASSHWPLLGSL